MMQLRGDFWDDEEGGDDIAPAVGCLFAFMWSLLMITALAALCWWLL